MFMISFCSDLFNFLHEQIAEEMTRQGHIYYTYNLHVILIIGLVELNEYTKIKINVTTKSFISFNE